MEIIEKGYGWKYQIRCCTCNSLLEMQRDEFEITHCGTGDDAKFKCPICGPSYALVKNIKKIPLTKQEYDDLVKSKES